MTAAVALALLAPPLAGQSASDRRDGHPFRTPLASPYEPATRLAPVLVERDGRSRFVGLVDFGERLTFPLRRPREDGWALSAEVAGGAWSRFDLERGDNEFIEAHFRAALRLRAGRGPLSLRVELFHASSHLGDEFLQRTGREPVSTSREGLELLAQAAGPGALRLYGGPGLLFRSSEALGSASLRAGALWPPSRRAGGPYAALEVFAWEERGWEPQATLEAGFAFGPRLRLGLLAGSGPSRAEQFLEQDERLLGLAFTIAPVGTP